MILVKILFILVLFPLIGRAIEAPSGGTAEFQGQQQQKADDLAQKRADDLAQKPADAKDSKELNKTATGRIKDPFMLSKQLYLKIKKKAEVAVVATAAGEIPIDDKVEPQRRWPLREYKLVAIIWNVKNPKAMISDKLKNLNMFKVGDYIGNAGGVIKSIKNGHVIVNEIGTETALKIAK